MTYPNIKFFATLLLLSLVAQHSCSYRILGVFPHPGRSHHVVFDVVLKGLAARGHEVTVISHFPTENPPKNFRDISLAGSLDAFELFFKFEDFSFHPWTERFMRPYVTAKLLADLGAMTCAAMLGNERVHEIRRGDFDLVITEQFSTDCGLGLVHKLQVPFVGLCSHVPMPYSMERFGLIENPAFVASHQTPFPPRGSLLQCIEALFVNAFYKLFYRFVAQRSEHALMTKYYGDDLPDLETIARNASLMLGSTYFVINGAHPKPPNYVEIGGINLQEKKPKNLSADLQKFVDGAGEQGFILFCMGSMIQAKSWSEDRLNAFKSAFAELPHRVIWKWDDESMDGVPKNVKVMRWIPQYDLLSQKNIRAFITHGGMLGMTEAAYFGVPVLVLPLYSDQPHNGAAAADKGMGIVMDVKNVTKESILWGLGEVLKPQYAARAKKLSAMYRDRPATSLETALFWIEHVARHGGGDHMRSPAMDIPLYRYLLLDVFAVIGLFLAIILYLGYIIVKCLFCRGKASGSSVGGGKRKNKRD